MTDKKMLRAAMRARKGDHTVQQRAAWSEQICHRVCLLPAWQQAHTVMLYMALADEVDVSLLLREALCAGKRVVLPVVKGEDMAVRLAGGDTSYVQGAYGISEPQGDDFCDLAAIDLVVVPGMAFDAEGGRLGRGKGYYDRFLPRVAAVKVGVCFPFQCVEKVPAEEHDQRMDVVVSQ